MVMLIHYIWRQLWLWLPFSEPLPIYWSALYRHVPTEVSQIVGMVVWWENWETHKNWWFTDSLWYHEICGWCQYSNLSRIQESADIAHKWSQDNDMRINSSKTKEMCIYFSKDSDFNDSMPNIMIDDVNIARVNHANVLGVTISDNLTWNIHVHVESVISKAGKSLCMLYQLKRSGISQADVLKIYVSVIRPVMEYACPVWHTCLPKYLSDDLMWIWRPYGREHWRVCILGATTMNVFQCLIYAQYTNVVIPYVENTSSKLKMSTTNSIIYYLQNEMCHMIYVHAIFYQLLLLVQIALQFLLFHIR